MCFNEVGIDFSSNFLTGFILTLHAHDKASDVLFLVLVVVVQSSSLRDNVDKRNGKKHSATEGIRNGHARLVFAEASRLDGKKTCNHSDCKDKDNEDKFDSKSRLHL